MELECIKSTSVSVTWYLYETSLFSLFLNFIICKISITMVLISLDV